MDDDVQKIITYYNFKEDKNLSIYFKYIKIFYKKFKFYLKSFNRKISPEIREKTYDDACQSNINDFKFWFNKEKTTQLFSYKNNMFIASGGLTQRIWQYYLFRCLEKTSPSKVLEIGSGNGINLCLFSSYFEEINFTGIDISLKGVENSIKLKNKILDESFFLGWPLPLKNKKPGKISFEKCNATKLNFNNQEFDFVYSILALEQMDDIKDKVITEMVRVSNKYVMLIEPFKEYNNSILKFFHHKGSKYFSYTKKNLSDFNLKILEVFEDHPNKVTLGVCAILCEKVNK